jgi:hypothetical protein
MTNYNFTKDDFLIMSKCMSLGFICYAVAIKAGNKPLVVMEVQYQENVPKRSSQPPFDQKYLGYKMFQVYKQFYERIKNKI